MTTQTRLIRWMQNRDIDLVVDIERCWFRDARTAEDIMHELRRRNFCGVVVEDGTELLGYGFYELFEARLHLVRFAVHPHCTRIGAATSMVQRLKERVIAAHRRTIDVVVPECALAAQLFLKSQDFRCIATAAGPSGDDEYLFRWFNEVRHV